MKEDIDLKNAIDNFITSLEEVQNKTTHKENLKLPKEIEKTKNQNFVLKEKGLEKILNILKKIVKLISLEDEVDIKFNKDDMIFSIYGNNLAILIGKNGRTIEALEYLLNTIAKRKKLAEKTIIIDVKDYRKQNIKKINKIALKMADKAIKENRKIALWPMPSYERKIVHDLLSKIKEVKTASKDEEPNRRIVIYPIISKG